MNRCAFSALLFVFFAALCSGQSKRQETGAVTGVRQAYDKARGEAFVALNRTYAAQAELLVKSFMAIGSLEDANRGAAFVKRLGDANEENDLEGIAGAPQANDRLAVLQARYAVEREAVARRISGIYAQKARALQQQFMRSGDLEGANQAAAFATEVAPARAAVAGAAQAPPARGINLLNPTFARKWKVKKGEWKFEGDKLVGSGDSEIVYDDGAVVPFTLQFKIKVLEGMRPRVFLGGMAFANEGYDKTFGLYPGGKDGKLFRYKHNTDYKITLAVAKKKVELFVDDQLITTGPGVEKVGRFAFCAGDGWSKGKVEYRDIVITR